MNLEKFKNWVSQNYNIKETDVCMYIYLHNKKVITINKQTKKAIYESINIRHQRICDLNKEENYSVIALILILLKKGYSANSIILEYPILGGHSDDYLDVLLEYKANNIKKLYMIEVKKYDEFFKYIKPLGEKVKQVFSYAERERDTELVSYFTFDFQNNKPLFRSCFVKELLKNSSNVDDLISKWNKQWVEDNIIEENDIFNIKTSTKKYENLKNIEEEDKKILFLQFKEILRINAISDKSNAFNKMINLFLAKIADELMGNTEYKIKDESNNIHNVYGLKFQFLDNLDNPISFLKRLDELYKIGMKQYLDKEIIDYTDEEINRYSSDEELLNIIDNLRLKKNNAFAFIEVFDDKTFLDNFYIVKDVVKLIENYKFRYEYKNQFLGVFFEELLNTALKQEEGQFFTPIPLVDFMINVLPIKEKIKENINNNLIDFIPTMIDYACGAGHFLLSYMNKIQDIIKSDILQTNNIQIKRDLDIFKQKPYSWVKKENVIGIEKDYRLAKTTKIATFLNGDGVANILSGDGINKFNSNEYQNSILFNQNNKTENIDFVISNPPYSIDGFMNNFYKNNISINDNTFSLLTNFNLKATNIEIYFVERTWQLLKNNAYCSIILPQSILTGDDKYAEMRDYIFKNFKIEIILMLSDITFFSTTTSPVILFMKKINISNLDYRVMCIFSDKYKEPTKNKVNDEEKKFLGYKFSSNKYNSSVEVIEDSKLKKIIPIANNFILNNNINLLNIDDELKGNIYIKNIKDIVVNKIKNENIIRCVFPKYENINGNSLSKYFNINIKRENNNYKYIEISSISNNTIVPTNKKNMNGNVCYKNDILLSSLVTTKDKIIISNDNYLVSTVIYILSIKEEYKDKLNCLYDELRKDYVIEQIHSLLEGFKITYSKISEYNLMNNVKLKLNI